MKIASVDPGGRTGLVTLDIAESRTVFVGGRGFGKRERVSSTIVIDALKDDRLFWENIDGTEEQQARTIYYKVRDLDVVIIEDFQLPAKVHTRNRELLSPVRIGFGLSLLLNMSPRFNGRIVWQQPTQMGVITDDRLRSWGLWLPGEKNKDIRSAMKHLIIYLRGGQ